MGQGLAMPPWLKRPPLVITHGPGLPPSSLASYPLCSFRLQRVSGTMPNNSQLRPVLVTKGEIEDPEVVRFNLYGTVVGTRSLLTDVHPLVLNSFLRQGYMVGKKDAKGNRKGQGHVGSRSPPPCAWRLFTQLSPSNPTHPPFRSGSWHWRPPTAGRAAGETHSSRWWSSPASSSRPSSSTRCSAGACGTLRGMGLGWGACLLA